MNHPPPPPRPKNQRKPRSVRRKIALGSLIAVGRAISLLIIAASFFSREATR